MALTKTVNSKANMKQTTSSDLSFAPAFPVAGVYTAVSTAGQSTIANLGFTVDTTNPQSLFLIVDGKYLTYGATSDFTFSAIDANGYSSSIQLNQTLAVGLNINAVKFSIKKESEFQTDNRFTQLYEAEGQGFQAFVNTANVLTAVSSAGTPAVGTFYSTIIGRAPVTDFTQDLKPRMGVERIMTQSVYQIQTETGPNGEPVFGMPNDTANQIRFVGVWSSSSDTYGSRAQSNVTGDYVEITFYGTGLNILITNNNTYAVSASIDGGTASANVYPPANGLISGRNYASNTVINVASGLAQGVHTVKLVTTSSTYPILYGFEILNTTAAVVTNPGAAYNSGKKVILPTLSSVAYNSVATGVRGGRILQYLSSAGSVAQSWQPVNATTALGNLTDHTNEEMARTYNFREFGAARGDDFSSNIGSASNLTFTLDDGSTTFAAYQVIIRSYVAANPPGIEFNINGSYMYLTFIGTGIDVILADTVAGGADSYTFQVDGGTAQPWPYTTGSLAVRSVKFASGLPYGTHTLRMTRVTATTYSPAIMGFKVYQPKKPVLPSGAIELADYNVLASYVPTTSASIDAASAGVIRKANAREIVLSGSFGLGVDVTNFFSGISMSCTTSGSYAQYTFLGSGVDIETYFSTSGSANFTVTIDGSANLSSFSTSLVAPGAGVSFNTTTGLVSGTTSVSGAAKLTISGLAYGLHTVRMTANSTFNMWVGGFDVQTLIYSIKSNLLLDAQNTAMVGSQGISDNRKLSPLKDLSASKKNVAQTYGLNTTPSTSSTSPVPLSDLSLAHYNSSGQIKISYSVNAYNSSGATTGFTQVVVDGQLAGTSRANAYVNSGYTQLYTDSFVLSVSPGFHKIDVYWWLNSGTLNSNPTARVLLVEEK